MPPNSPVDLLNHIILNAQIIPCSMFLRILLLPSAFPSVFAFSIHISNSSAAYLIPKPTALLQGIPCCDICVWNIQINFLWCRCYLENGSLCKGEVHLEQLHFRKIIRVGGKITLRPKPSRVFSGKKETYESFAGFYLVSFMAGRELALSLVFCHETVILSNWPPRNNCTGHRHHFLLGMA